MVLGRGQSPARGSTLSKPRSWHPRWAVWFHDPCSWWPPWIAAEQTFAEGRKGEMTTPGLSSVGFVMCGAGF